MGRTVRHAVALVSAGLLLAAGCSKSDSTTGSAGGASSTSTTAAATSTVPSTSPATTATTSATASTTSGTAQSTTTAPSGPLVASAQGWRLAVTAPTGGARVGSSMTVCYEITGTSREPVLVLEVVALPAGSASGAAPIRVDAAVGRGSVRVPLNSIQPGVYHLRVQLILNGQPLDGVAFTIPSVTLAPDIPPAGCP